MEDNKIMNFSDTFKTYYQNNAFSLFLYKSGRKNSKCELININHLINKKDDRKIDDARILEQLCGVLEKSVYYFKKCGHTEARIYGHIFKQSVYINANCQKYGSVDDINIDTEKKEFYSIEQYINFLYDKFSLIYPYNTIARRELFNNSSIKYYINLYYSK